MKKMCNFFGILPLYTITCQLSWHFSGGLPSLLEYNSMHMLDGLAINATSNFEFVIFVMG